MARLPPYRETRTGVKKVLQTAYTNRQARWESKMGMENWNRRPNAQAKAQSRANARRQRDESTGLDAGTDIPTEPPHSVMGALYGHDLYGQGDPYTEATRIEAGSSPFDTDDAWVTTRETSMLPDIDMNELPPRYPSPPSSHHYLDNFDFSLFPPFDPQSHRLESEDYEKLFEGEFNHDDHDNNGGDDLLGLEGVMGTFVDPNLLNPDMTLDGEDLLRDLGLF